MREDRNQRYANRVRQLAEIEGTEKVDPALSVVETKRRSLVLVEADDGFWTKPGEGDASQAYGIDLIKQVKLKLRSKESKPKAN